MTQWDALFWQSNVTQTSALHTSRESVEEAMVDYMEHAHQEDGCPWYAIARHMLGLYHGQRGARLWRQVWSDHKLKPLAPEKSGKRQEREWRARRKCQIVEQALKFEVTMIPVNQGNMRCKLNHWMLQTKSPTPKSNSPKLTIWAIPLFWTVNHIVARKAPGVITPHVLAIARWALVGIFLAWLARVELKANWEVLRTQVWRYILLGALGMWVCGAGVYQAGVSTTMVNISLIYASSPVMIAVCSVLWLHEPFSKRQALGVFIAILVLCTLWCKGVGASCASRLGARRFMDTCSVVGLGGLFVVTKTLA
jgi:uncharacterized membrane protein